MVQASCVDVTVIVESESEREMCVVGFLDTIVRKTGYRVRVPRLPLWFGVAISSTLMWIAQPPHGCAFIGAVCLVPWLLATGRNTPALLAISGCAFGSIYGALAIEWAPSSIAELGYSVPSAIALWVLAALLFGGLPWMVFGIALGFLRKTKSAATHAIGAGLSVLVIDWVRSSGAALVAPWVLLGHSQASSPGVAQLAVIGGVPLISGLLAALNVATADLIRPATQRHRSVTIALTLWGAFGALGLFGLNVSEWARTLESKRTAGRQLLVIQPNIPDGDRWNADVQRTNLAIVVRQTDSALATARLRPDFIVWPETTLTSPIEGDAALRSALFEAAKQLDRPLILGIVQVSKTGVAGRYRNSAAWLDPSGEIVDRIDKTRGVPLLESEGAHPQDALRSLLRAPTGPLMEPGMEQRPLRGSAEFAVVLCYEAMLPGLTGARRTDQTLAILNLANDSWLTSDSPVEQQIAFSSFRAIEQRLWFIRAAHGGASVVVDPLGRRVASLPRGEAGALEVTISAEAPASVQEKAALLACGASGSLFALALRRLLGRMR